MQGKRGFPRVAGPASPGLFLACVAGHAVLIAAFWSAPARPPSPWIQPALLPALPAAETPTLVPTRGRALRPSRPTRDARHRPAPSRALKSVNRTPFEPRGIDLGGAALAEALTRPGLPRAGPPDPSSAEVSPPVPTAARADDDTALGTPPSAAWTPPPALRRADVQLEYHRMRAAQEALRLHASEGAHLAWLRERVTGLLATAAGPAPEDGALCTADLDGGSLSLRCDVPALAERLVPPEEDLAVYLRKLLTLTAPGEALTIAFLPDRPPIVGGP